MNRARLVLRRLWRLFAFATVLLAATLYLNLTVRWRRAEQRPAYRALRQKNACRRALKAIGVETVVTGTRPVKIAHLIVSNHLGILDPFVIGSLFLVVFSGKAEMFNWPVAGWVCRSIGLIPVYRTRKTATASFAEEVAHRLDHGINVLVFPEGTTTGGTNVQQFKTGAFAAIEHAEDRFVLPATLKVVSVNGQPPDAATHKLLTWSDPSVSLFEHVWQTMGVRRVAIEVVLGEEIHAGGRSRKDLATRSFTVISQESGSQLLAE